MEIKVAALVDRGYSICYNVYMRGEEKLTKGWIVFLILCYVAGCLLMPTGCARPTIQVAAVPHLRSEATASAKPKPTLDDRIAKWSKHVGEHCVDPRLDVRASEVTWKHKIWGDRREDDPFISCGSGKARLRYLLHRENEMYKAAAEEMKRNPPIKGRIRYGKGPLVFK